MFVGLDLAWRAGKATFSIDAISGSLRTFDNNNNCKTNLSAVGRNYYHYYYGVDRKFRLFTL